MRETSFLNYMENGVQSINRSTITFYHKIGIFIGIYNIPANNYSFKINNRNTRKKWEGCSKLSIKTLDDII